MNTFIKFPLYAKASIILVGVYVLISMLVKVQVIILPIIFATIFAVLISPVVNFLELKKINRAIAITMVLIALILIIAAVIAFLSSQANLLKETLPGLKIKFKELLAEIHSWTSVHFNISEQKINDWIANSKNELSNNSSSLIGSTLSSMGGVFAALMLTPVYIFLILLYQSHLRRFIHQLFGVNNFNKISEMLTETKKIVQSYLIGLFIEFAIIAVMNCLGLLLLGIDYAILLGIVGALLNIIPYLGGLIAVALFSGIALVTKSPIYVLYVIALYSFIQFIDNNYIVPKIVGSKVKLNALISIVAVIAGAALWGIPGMFLSIPITAIIKLVFDRFESLKPWGFLLGDTLPPLIKLKLSNKDEKNNNET